MSTLFISNGRKILIENIRLIKIALMILILAIPAAMLMQDGLAYYVNNPSLNKSSAYASETVTATFSYNLVIFDIGPTTDLYLKIYNYGSGAYVRTVTGPQNQPMSGTANFGFTPSVAPGTYKVYSYGTTDMGGPSQTSSGYATLTVLSPPNSAPTIYNVNQLTTIERGTSSWEFWIEVTDDNHADITVTMSASSYQSTQTGWSMTSTQPTSTNPRRYSLDIGPMLSLSTLHEGYIQIYDIVVTDGQYNADVYAWNGDEWFFVYVQDTMLPEFTSSEYVPLAQDVWDTVATGGTSLSTQFYSSTSSPDDNLVKIWAYDFGGFSGPSPPIMNELDYRLSEDGVSWENILNPVNHWSTASGTQLYAEYEIGDINEIYTHIQFKRLIRDYTGLTRADTLWKTVTVWDTTSPVVSSLTPPGIPGNNIITEWLFTATDANGILMENDFPAEFRPIVEIEVYSDPDDPLNNIVTPRGDVVSWDIVEETPDNYKLTIDPSLGLEDQYMKLWVTVHDNRGNPAVMTSSIIDIEDSERPIIIEYKEPGHVSWVVQADDQAGLWEVDDNTIDVRVSDNAEQTGTTVTLHWIIYDDYATSSIYTAEQTISITGQGSIDYTFPFDLPRDTIGMTLEYWISAIDIMNNEETGTSFKRVRDIVDVSAPVLLTLDHVPWVTSSDDLPGGITISGTNYVGVRYSRQTHPDNNNNINPLILRIVPNSPIDGLVTARTCRVTTIEDETCIGWNTDIQFDTSMEYYDWDLSNQWLYGVNYNYIAFYVVNEAAYPTGFKLFLYDDSSDLTEGRDYNFPVDGEDFKVNIMMDEQYGISYVIMNYCAFSDPQTECLSAGDYSTMSFSGLLHRWASSFVTNISPDMEYYRATFTLPALIYNRGYKYFITVGDGHVTPNTASYGDVGTPYIQVWGDGIAPQVNPIIEIPPDIFEMTTVSTNSSTHCYPNGDPLICTGYYAKRGDWIYIHFDSFSDLNGIGVDDNKKILYFTVNDPHTTPGQTLYAVEIVLVTGDTYIAAIPPNHAEWLAVNTEQTPIMGYNFPTLSDLTDVYWQIEVSDEANVGEQGPGTGLFNTVKYPSLERGDDVEYKSFQIVDSTAGTGSFITIADRGLDPMNGFKLAMQSFTSHVQNVRIKIEGSTSGYLEIYRDGNPLPWANQVIYPGYRTYGDIPSGSYQDLFIFPVVNVNGYVDETITITIYDNDILDNYYVTIDLYTPDQNPGGTPDSDLFWSASFADDAPVRYPSHSVAIYEIQPYTRQIRTGGADYGSVFEILANDDRVGGTIDHVEFQYTYTVDTTIPDDSIWYNTDWTRTINMDLVSYDPGTGVYRFDIDIEDLAAIISGGTVDDIIFKFLHFRIIIYDAAPFYNEAFEYGGYVFVDDGIAPVINVLSLPDMFDGIDDQTTGGEIGPFIDVDESTLTTMTTTTDLVLVLQGSDNILSDSDIYDFTDAGILDRWWTAKAYYDGQYITSPIITVFNMDPVITSHFTTMDNEKYLIFIKIDADWSATFPGGELRIDITMKDISDNIATYSAYIFFSDDLAPVIDMDMTPPNVGFLGTLENPELGVPIGVTQTITTAVADNGNLKSVEAFFEVRAYQDPNSPWETFATINLLDEGTDAYDTLTDPTTYSTLDGAIHYFTTSTAGDVTLEFQLNDYAIIIAQTNYVRVYDSFTGLIIFSKTYSGVDYFTDPHIFETFSIPQGGNYEVRFERYVNDHEFDYILNSITFPSGGRVYSGDIRDFPGDVEVRYHVTAEDMIGLTSTTSNFYYRTEVTPLEVTLTQYFGASGSLQSDAYYAKADEAIVLKQEAWYDKIVWTWVGPIPVPSYEMSQDGLTVNTKYTINSDPTEYQAPGRIACPDGIDATAEAMYFCPIIPWNSGHMSSGDTLRVVVEVFRFGTFLGLGDGHQGTGFMDIVVYDDNAPVFVPVASTLPSGEVKTGQDIPIAFTVTDNQGITSLDVVYRIMDGVDQISTNMISWLSDGTGIGSMVSNAPNEYTFDMLIPGAEILSAYQGFTIEIDVIVKDDTYHEIDGIPMHFANILTNTDIGSIPITDGMAPRITDMIGYAENGDTLFTLDVTIKDEESRLPDGTTQVTGVAATYEIIDPNTMNVIDSGDSTSMVFDPVNYIYHFEFSDDLSTYYGYMVRYYISANDNNNNPASLIYDLGTVSVPGVIDTTIPEIAGSIIFWTSTEFPNREYVKYTVNDPSGSGIDFSSISTYTNNPYFVLGVVGTLDKTGYTDGREENEASILTSCSVYPCVSDPYPFFSVENVFPNGTVVAYWRNDIGDTNNPFLWGSMTSLDLVLSVPDNDDNVFSTSQYLYTLSDIDAPIFRHNTVNGVDISQTHSVGYSNMDSITISVEMVDLGSNNLTGYVYMRYLGYTSQLEPQDRTYDSSDWTGWTEHQMTSIYSGGGMSFDLTFQMSYMDMAQYYVYVYDNNSNVYQDILFTTIEITVDDIPPSNEALTITEISNANDFDVIVDVIDDGNAFDLGSIRVEAYDDLLIPDEYDENGDLVEAEHYETDWHDIHVVDLNVELVTNATYENLLRWLLTDLGPRLHYDEREGLYNELHISLFLADTNGNEITHSYTRYVMDRIAPTVIYQNIVKEGGNVDKSIVEFGVITEADIDEVWGSSPMDRITFHYNVGGSWTNLTIADDDLTNMDSSYTIGRDDMHYQAVVAPYAAGTLVEYEWHAYDQYDNLVISTGSYTTSDRISPLVENVGGIIAGVDYMNTSITVDVTEVFGLDYVTLRYMINGDDNWISVAMNNTSGNLYNGIIPGMPVDTHIDWEVLAVDIANNEGSISGSYITYDGTIPSISIQAGVHSVGETIEYVVSGSEWFIPFTQVYSDPVVVVTSVINTIRNSTYAEFPVILGTSSTGVYMQQFDDGTYDNNFTSYAQVNIFVIEAGRYRIGNNTVIEARNMNITSSDYISYQNTYATVPAVLTGIYGSSSQYRSSVYNATSVGFNTHLSNNTVELSDAMIMGYVAISGIGEYQTVASSNFTTQLYNSTGVLFTGMFNSIEYNSYAVLSNITGTDFSIGIEEINSADQIHNNESVFILELPRGIFNVDYIFNMTLVIEANITDSSELISVVMQYRIDGGDWIEVVMSLTDQYYSYEIDLTNLNISELLEVIIIAIDKVGYEAISEYSILGL